MSVKRVSKARIYGRVTEQPETLAVNLERQLVHSFNRSHEQLAMAPPDTGSSERAIATLVGGCAPRAVFDLDIDMLG